MQHILLNHFDKLQLFVDGSQHSSLHTKFAYRVKISQALVHLCVAEDGVTFTDPPEHTLKRLHLHPLNQSWDKPAAHKHHMLIKHKQLCGLKVRCNDLYKRYKISAVRVCTMTSEMLFVTHPSLAPSLCILVQPVTDSVSRDGNSSYWGPRASC